MLLPLCAKALQSRLRSAIDLSLRNRFEDVVIQLNKFFAKHPLQEVAGRSREMASKILPTTSAKAIKPKTDAEKREMKEQIHKAASVKLEDKKEKVHEDKLRKEVSKEKVHKKEGDVKKDEKVHKEDRIHEDKPHKEVSKEKLQKKDGDITKHDDKLKTKTDKQKLATSDEAPANKTKVTAAKQY